MAMTAVNLSMFYLRAMLGIERSLAYAKEVLIATLPFVEFLPAVQNYANAALKVAQAWGQVIIIQARHHAHGAIIIGATRQFDHLTSPLHGAGGGPLTHEGSLLCARCNRGVFFTRSSSIVS